jgi:predicted metal-dependent HD superfamily phosphohydrolase
VTADTVVDVDLSILGEQHDTYHRYAHAIRKEFGHISDDAWRVGRSKFLKEMLDRPTIYRRHEMQSRYERQARDNMQRELTTLQGDQR